MVEGIAAALALRPRPSVVVVLTDGYTPWPDREPRGARVVIGMVGPGTVGGAGLGQARPHRAGPVTASLRDEARTAGPAAARWHDGLPDVVAELDCGGQVHRVSWRRGSLVLEDHHLLAERSLMALGSEPPLCVEVLDAWRARRGPALLGELVGRDTEAIEDLAARRIEHMEAIRRGQAFIAGSEGKLLRGLLASTQRGIEEEKRAWSSTLLRALPFEFRRRLALAVIVEIQRRWHDEAFRDEHREHLRLALDATAATLLERSARRSGRSFGVLAHFAIESRVLAPGQSPQCDLSFTGRGGSGAVALPISWFTEVWGPGLGLVGDCFVTRRDGDSPDPAALPVQALKWERGRDKVTRSREAPAVVARGEDGAWALHWA